MACPATITVDKNYFLIKDVLGRDPEDASKFCLGLQQKWKTFFSTEAMKDFSKSKTIHLVWVSDKFGDTLPDNLSEAETYQLLSSIYDEMDAGDRARESAEVVEDAEQDRKSVRQLKQHLRAFLHLKKSEQPLSEKLICDAHEILMKDLQRDGVSIDAGKYRTAPVSAGMHTFASPNSVPSLMTKLVEKYNKDTQRHPFERASTLLYKFLQIHPFLDGNGRLSRLLWCYSLMNDGLPFPTVPFPSSDKPYKKYIRCLRKEQNTIQGEDNYKCITALTLVSVTQAWKNFLSNMKMEHPKKYKEIFTWMEGEHSAMLN